MKYNKGSRNKKQNRIFIIGTILYVCFIIIYSIGRNDADLLVYTSTPFENTMLFLCILPCLIFTNTTFFLYRFHDIKEMMEYVINVNLKYVYVYISSTMLMKLIIVFLYQIEVDIIFLMYYLVLTFFVYTIYGITFSLLSLIPKRKISMLLLLLVASINLILIYTNANVAMIFSPALILLKLSELNIVYFFLSVAFYVILNSILWKKIQRGEYSD